MGTGRETLGWVSRAALGLGGGPSDRRPESLLWGLALQTSAHWLGSKVGPLPHCLPSHLQGTGLLCLGEVWAEPDGVCVCVCVCARARTRVPACVNMRGGVGGHWHADEACVVSFLIFGLLLVFSVAPGWTCGLLTWLCLGTSNPLKKN